MGFNFRIDLGFGTGFFRTNGLDVSNSIKEYLLEIVPDIVGSDCDNNEFIVGDAVGGNGILDSAPTESALPSRMYPLSKIGDVPSPKRSFFNASTLFSRHLKRDVIF